MKKIAVLLLLCVCLGSVLAGCSGMVDGPGDRWRRHSQITDDHARQFVDDWDYLMLYDHNSRLSEYHTRIGK